MRLLPRDGSSWTAYVWLIYLSGPIWFAAAGATTSPWGGLLTAVAVIVFLPLYFWGYWLEGRASLAQLTGIAVIAALLSPINPGAAVFFVYAASFAGRVGRPQAGALVLAALLVEVALETWLVRLPIAVWASAIPLIVLIGGLNISFLEIGRRQTTLRRAAEADARRLAVVAERERIGRDLHDLLGHTLSVITLKAELASKLAAHDPERAIAEIRDVEHISRDALTEVRRAVQGYGRATLAGELEQARIALESAGAALDCRMDAVELSPAAEHALALSVREAVTNVIRHARARHCHIRLVASGPSLQLEVRDDGRGGLSPDGSGLIGMRARVADLGGRVERDGRDGTRLTITVPAPQSSVAPLLGSGA